MIVLDRQVTQTGRATRAPAGGPEGAQAIIREARRRGRRRRLLAAGAGLLAVAGSTAGVIATKAGGPVRATAAAFRAAVPQPLHGLALAGHTGLGLLVAGDPPYLLNVDSGAVTSVTGLDTKGTPVVSLLGVGRDAVVWLDRPGPVATLPRAQIYVLRHGTTRATRIATGWDVAPASGGRAIWVVSYRRAHNCALSELALNGHPLRAARPVGCSVQLPGPWSGPGPAIDPATGRTLPVRGSLWTVDGPWALAATAQPGAIGPGAPLTLTDTRTGRSWHLDWPSRIPFTDQSVVRPGGRLMVLDFADPAYKGTGTQVMDAWLFDPATRRFTHLPDMPAAVHLKFTSMAWASDGRLVMLAQSGGPDGDRNVVAVWKPGQAQWALRPIPLPARTGGNDAFVVW